LEVLQGRVRWYSLLSLLLLAASMAEFLTGSTRIQTAIYHPVGFLILVGMYGGGALLIREAAVRWGKRWGAMLLLGGAYAVGEEGFGAKTLVDPTGSNIGNQLYTHFAGINWVPLASLTLFHAAFSIAVPLVLVELIFPETKGKPLVGRAGLGVSMFVYALAVFLVSHGDPYPTPPAVLLFLAVYAVAFVVAAYLSPKGFFTAKGEGPDRPERRFVLLGIGFMGSFFLIDVLGAHFFPWPVAAALFVPLAFLVARYLAQHAGRAGNEPVKIGFVLGVVLVFVPIDVLNELNGDLGVLVYTGAIVALCLWVGRRIGKGTG
jgi:hypothetical protein